MEFRREKNCQIRKKSRSRSLSKEKKTKSIEKVQIVEEEKKSEEAPINIQAPLSRKQQEEENRFQLFLKEQENKFKERMQILEQSRQNRRNKIAAQRLANGVVLKFLSTKKGILEIEYNIGAIPNNAVRHNCPACLDAIKENEIFYPFHPEDLPEGQVGHYIHDHCLAEFIEAAKDEDLKPLDPVSIYSSNPLDRTLACPLCKTLAASIRRFSMI